MIVDLARFVERERPYWRRLEKSVARLEEAPAWPLEMNDALTLHYLYERAAAALNRIHTFSSDPEVTGYLESLVARAYAVIHSADRRRRRFRPVRWFFGTFPRTFRTHARAFALATAVTLAGSALGAFALAVDDEAKGVIMPFEGLKGDPSNRVEQEEAGGEDDQQLKTAFSSMLMTHNTRVSIIAMALGLTFGVGTILLLFYNGVILGAVVFDYLRAGEGVFLTGWLLPHGAVEIPAILIAGQAGLVLASAIIGRGAGDPLKVRMRQVLPGLVTLIFGVAVLLVWAGLIEAFLSQYHHPVLPYWLKISFGCVELVLLGLFLGLSGRRGAAEAAEEAA